MQSRAIDDSGSAERSAVVLPKPAQARTTIRRRIEETGSGLSDIGGFGMRARDAPAASHVRPALRKPSQWLA